MRPPTKYMDKPYRCDHCWEAFDRCKADECTSCKEPRAVCYNCWRCVECGEQNEEG